MIYAIRNTKYEIRATTYDIRTIMQNKPNFRKAKMKLNFYSTKDYENQPRLRAPGKQTQSNPISKAKKCCGVFPENFCERKQAKTGIDVNEQA